MSQTTNRRTFLSHMAGTAAIAAVGLPLAQASASAAATDAESRLLMTFTPAPSFPIPSAPVLSKLQDFVLALRIAEAKLDMAEDEFTDAGFPDLKEMDLTEAKASAKLYASIFESITTGASSTISPRVFRTIRDYVNQDADNPPHIEGAMLALSLALLCIHEALQLSATLDAGKIDAAYELMLSADFALGAHNSMIQGVTYSFHHDEAFAAILANSPMPDHRALRRKAIEEHKRNKAAKHEALAKAA